MLTLIKNCYIIILQQQRYCFITIEEVDIMTKMEKYEMAWQKYLHSCEKYGFQTPIDFIDFIQTLTNDQLEVLVADAI